MKPIQDMTEHGPVAHPPGLASGGVCVPSFACSNTPIQRAARLKYIESLDVNDPVGIQFDIMMESLEIYNGRGRKYNDNWRRFGWRGCLFRLRERAERAWDHWWGQSELGWEGREAPADVDDLLDLINFACFTIRAIREDNRDGSWF